MSVLPLADASYTYMVRKSNITILQQGNQYIILHLKIFHWILEEYKISAPSSHAGEAR